MKHKILDKRGFTLIELLAVITILAIIMLFAASGVTTILTRSQKRAFVIDAQKIVESAKLVYTDALLNNQTKGAKTFCMSIEYLKQHGLEKAGGIKGSVLVDVTEETAAYKIWYDNGQFQVSGMDISALTYDHESLVGSTGTISEDCDNTGTKF